MDCSLSSLIEASRCYRCIPKPVMQASAISLLCQWANNLTPPLGPFSWAPPSAIATWSDSGGIQFGDLPTFNATADIPTVTVVDLKLAGITAISNVASLPALSVLSVFGNSLTSLNLSGCTNLQNVDCYTNSISSLILTGCTSLAQLDCHDNLITSLIVNGCSSMANLSCYQNALTSLNCGGLSFLFLLDCSTNQLGQLTITGCVSLTSLWTWNNPSLVVVP